MSDADRRSDAQPPKPAAQQLTPMPSLRRDLTIDLIDHARGGLPSAIVGDQIRASFFQLPWPESVIFLAWRDATTKEDLLHKLRHRFGLQPSTHDIDRVFGFALTNQLTQSDASGSWRQLSGLHEKNQRGVLTTMLHGYLFFRMPLVRPERALKAALPQLSFLFSRSFLILITSIAIIGLYLAARQWSAVTAAAADALQMQSLLLYAVVVLGLKACHEFGHALTTVRYGCRVPSMGIAVMLGTPVFYTDTTDSWRLSRKSERLAIVFAGVAAEAIVAACAILLWSFLDDGLLRNICFAISTASIALSIAINLNPFMRYDGYFALSDYLDVPNLQPRAFALGTWKLREFLFDLKHDPPEQLAARLHLFLIVYAALTAIYRLLLFLGIALLVYTVAGKAIGIVLGLFEIIVFIAQPIAKEFMTWWKLRDEIKRRARSARTGACLAATLAALLVPWLSTVEASAVQVAHQEEALYLPFAARIGTVLVASGQSVRAGDILFAADTSELEKNRERASLELRALEFQLARLQTSSREQQLRGIVASKLAQSREKLAAISRQMDMLVIHAPFDGRIVDLDSDIASGVWVNEKQPLARLISDDRSLVRGMLAEPDMMRVREGAKAVFIPDDIVQAPQPLILKSISAASDGSISEPMLADRNGGPIISHGERNKLQTRHGFFDVTFEEFPHTSNQVVRGVVWIDAQRVSPAFMLWRGVQRVFVREHGF